MSKQDPLFSPIRIGKMELKNRMVLPAMHLNYCPDGEVTDRLIEFYRVRAWGGVGLVIVGGCGIDRVGNTLGMIQLDEDRYIPGLQKLVEAVHQEGAKVMTQLYQAGNYASSLLTGNQPVAPSPLPSKLTKEIPHELTVEEIKELVQTFAQAAVRTQKAGFDGVEILAGTGYLISEFLSPATNKRTDEYGGDLPNRMRFALEIIAAIRQGVGPDFPVVVRIAGNDFIPGGHTNKEARTFAKALAAAGVDAINVTGGWHETLVPQITMNVPPAAFRYLVRGIKQVVDLPVFASNRITTPELARDILTSGDADLVGFARPILADPNLPLKAQGLDPSPLRPCVACNQGCLDHVFRGIPVACLVNAEAGREAELKGQGASSSPRKVLVVGAGPAGLEFARVASSQGHNITVWEKSSRPGGQLNLAAAPPERQDFNRFTEYLVQACKAQGVKIYTNQEADVENILAGIAEEDFTDIIFATGALPMAPPFPVEEGVEIAQAWDVLAGKETGEQVVIVGGGSVGVETALYLAGQGTLDAEILRFLIVNQAESTETLARLLFQGRKRVTLVEMTKGVGRDLGSSTRWAMLADLQRYQVKVLTNTMVKAVRADGVWVEGPEGESLIPGDTVISAVGSVANQELMKALQDKLPAHVTLQQIGDATKPAKVLDAVHTGYKAALSLG
ncbi:FAD-dependent oxidoreductase [Desulfitobacterium chlororespirans]|uniref:2,4-dienoyl-CoA reductase (NADPH2) n=1 Tax=Desulfitobacterium chlororespirans DSM 11544 TaxID=1121395 RepID=A0A1M7UA62_9FIRM|nr:FAD-dependent oxidoreductase [Desulfitobacterium chlororespirans]SHN79767.1 2,4-dienoyl-CoA reductase (NADPH2) [Desulfitobacterium chlororespirans DSM 11544]